MLLNLFDKTATEQGFINRMNDIRPYHEPEREDQRNVHTVGLLLLEIKSGLFLAEAVFFGNAPSILLLRLRGRYALDPACGRNGSRGSGRRKHRDRVERQSQRPPRPIPPDQDQSDWQKDGVNNLDSRLVRTRRRDDLPLACAGIGYAVVS